MGLIIALPPQPPLICIISKHGDEVEVQLEHYETLSHAGWRNFQRIVKKCTKGNLVPVIDEFETGKGVLKVVVFLQNLLLRW